MFFEKPINLALCCRQTYVDRERAPQYALRYREAVALKGVPKDSSGRLRLLLRTIPRETLARGAKQRNGRFDKSAPVGTRIELPKFRGLNGEWQTAITLPEEVRGLAAGVVDEDGDFVGGAHGFVSHGSAAMAS